MKRHFNKEPVMTKTMMDIFDNTYVDGDVKVRDHCHITEKYKSSARRNCNINVKLNYDSHLIMQELGKFNLKINVIPNGLEKYMSFNINNKLVFIDSFQFLSSSLDSIRSSSAKRFLPLRLYE